jgi:hypothetical protein
MLEYLPPQKNILHINFDRNSTQHKMELVLRKEGIVLIFGTVKRSLTGWERYFPQNHGKSNYSVAWELTIQPAEILSKDIQAWFSYLLSGLDKKFRPDEVASLVPSIDSGLNATLRKASA